MNRRTFTLSGAKTRQGPLKPFWNAYPLIGLAIRFRQ